MVSQQQLRFVTEGCLLSLKPLPLDGGLVSVDGILRPKIANKVALVISKITLPYSLQSRLTSKHSYPLKETGCVLLSTIWFINEEKGDLLAVPKLNILF